jgi:hypothetical protein
MPRITRLTVGRGRTSRPSDQEEWIREYFEVEADVSDLTTEESLDQARMSLERKLMSWLSEPTAPQIPKLDMAELERLPWKTYKDKQPCEPGDSGWILTNTEGAEELVKAIKAAPKEKLDLPPYQFTFSGKEKQFISRRRMKEG